jgi:DNA-directed RNA polymerase specialized sigma24 family protein
MANANHPDQIYIEGLANNDSAIIPSIYKKFVPKNVSYIRNNSGDGDKAQDVIQEIMILLFDQAKAKKLQLTCSFDAYFFLLFKRKWLNEIKKSSNKGATIDADFPSINESTQKLNVTDGCVRKKKSLCVGQLTQWVQETNRFQSLKTN